jgi:glycopeptide antibiotics resistance protein
MEYVYIEAIAMYILWLIAMFVLRDKARRIISVIGLILSIVLILFYTLSGRKSGSQEISLIPFITFVYAKNNSELYRSMFMNVFLFFPMGLTLPYALPEKWNRKAFITILCSMTLSIIIEYLQYHYHLGRAETDDVLCNTLGAIIGTLSYTLSRKFNRK